MGGAGGRSTGRRFRLTVRQGSRGGAVVGVGRGESHGVAGLASDGAARGSLCGRWVRYPKPGGRREARIGTHGEPRRPPVSSGAGGSSVEAAASLRTVRRGEPLRSPAFVSDGTPGEPRRGQWQGGPGGLFGRDGRGSPAPPAWFRTARGRNPGGRRLRFGPDAAGTPAAASSGRSDASCASAAAWLCFERGRLVGM